MIKSLLVIMEKLVVIPWFFSLAKALNCERKHIKNSNINYKQKILTTANNYKNTLNYNKGNKILFITISRNLLERYISMRFQLEGDKMVDKLNKKEITKNDIIKRYKSSIKNYIKSDLYFSMIENDLNIDIYNNISKDNKYLFLENIKDNIDFLFLKFEFINEWENIFLELFNFKFTIEKYNYTNNKKYYNLYKEIKPLVLTDDIYNNYKKTKHYNMYN